MADKPKEAPPNNPNPKQRFLTAPGLIKAYTDVMIMPGTRISLDYALMQYQHRLAAPINDTVAAAAHFKMVGAMEFIDELLNLTTVRENPTLTKKETIDHRV